MSATVNEQQWASPGRVEKDMQSARQSMESNSTNSTAKEEKAVRRKVDCAILPIMCFVYFLQYLDKQSLSYAGVFGLITDLNLTNSQFSWCSSIFYFGQLLSEYLFIYLMSRFPLPRLVGTTVVLWGIVCLCLATPRNFAGFAATRFLLGFTEGAVSPSFITITSIWYRKSEHAVRTALFLSMNGLAQVLGCFLMYGIGKNRSLTLDPWRTMFLICGAITVSVGIAFLLLIPLGPKDAWFLNAREKEILIVRDSCEREGGDKTSFSASQFKEAFLDIKTWLAFLFGLLGTMQAPVLTFATFVIKSTGYSQLDTMLYTAPSGAVQATMLWLGAGLYLMIPKQRTLVVIVLIVPPLVGNILLLKLTSSDWGVIVSAWLASCITAPMSVIISLVASNVKGNTKRAAVNAIFFIGYCTGSIAAPQLWTKAPRYTAGVITSIVTWILLFVVTLLYRFLCARENAKREKEAPNESAEINEGSTTENSALRPDLTDKQDGLFRYSL